MNNRIKKIIAIIIIIILALGYLTINSSAANFSITSGISEINVGDSYTISISAKGLTGRFNITHSSNVSVNLDSIWVENGSAEGTIKVTAKSEGKATVTLTPDEEFGVSDSNGLVSLSAKTDTVTVKAKSSSGNSSSGNSNSGSSENTKPSAPSFTSVNETVYATDSVNVRSSYSTSSSIIGSLSKGESVTRTGKSSSWSKVTYNGQTAYISSDYLTTVKPEETTKEDDKKEDEEEKSNTKNLKSLTVENYKLEPEFDPEVTEYNLTVGTDVEKLEVSAIPQDENSKVEITGNTDLLLGENTINIKVTAEDETVKIYKINVSKIEEVSLQLSKLEIENYTLTPEFSQDIYEYTLNIGDTSITSLNVIASSNTQNAVIEIAGNNELKPGKNIITVLVKDEENTTVYQIVVNISEEYNVVAKTGINDNDLYMYTGIAAGILIIIMIIIAIVKKRKKDNEEEFAPLNTYDLDLSMKDDNKKDKKNEDKTEKLEDDENSKEKVEIGVSNSDELTDEKTRKKGKHF